MSEAASGPDWYGFVSTERLEDYEGQRARVPPFDESSAAVIGTLRDHGDTFSVGDSEFRKDECAYVAVEGVECRDDRCLPKATPPTARYDPV